MVVIIIGSIASGAITGNAPLLPSIAANAAIMVMHWLFSGIGMRWHGFGVLINRSSSILVRRGDVDGAAMRAAHMTEHDLEQALRQQGVKDVAEVAEARLERNGSVSVIKE